MRVPWWYGVAVAALVWVIGFLILGFAPESVDIVERLTGPVVLALLVAWLAMPVCLSLDQRQYGDRLAWRPRTAVWVVASLVWFVNVFVGVAYSLRRYVAARGTPPSERWVRILHVTVICWTVAFALDWSFPDGSLPAPVSDAMAVVVLFAWVGMPTAVLIDAVRVRGYTDWNPNPSAFVAGTAVPLVGIAVCVAYLYKRRTAFEATDATRKFSLPTATGNGTDADGGGSPWFRRSAYVFGAYFLLMVLLGASVPSVSDTGLELLGLAVWVPFGPFFAGCVYKDAAWRRNRDRRVGDRWWIYLLSALIQGVAFWYLLRRAGKAGRYRRRRSNGTEADG